jgi:N-acetylglucosamine malate deacetylase 1
MTTVDILAFAPHPDDAEIFCAGTLLTCARAGLRIGIADLTRGELSTRGDPGTRAAETDAATRILALDARLNCDLPDGFVASTPEQRLAVIRVLRALRPRTVLLPWREDRHPDHANAHTLVREAIFLSGLVKIETVHDGTPQQPHRPVRAYAYMMHTDFAPEVIVDVSGVFETKLEAIRAYGTQVHARTSGEGPRTHISSPDFLEALIARARRLGFLAGVRYGEGLQPLQPQVLDGQALVS